MENTLQSSRGDWRAQPGRLGGAKAKANFLSRAFYTWLVGISSGVLDMQQGSRGDWALRWPDAGKASSDAYLLHVYVLFAYSG